MWALVAGVSAFRAFRGFDKVPATVSAASGLLILAAVALAWVRHARGTIPGRALLLAPLYVLWKVPLYVAFLFRRQKSWVRTARDPAGPPAP
jgi:hypothetical protein